MNKLIRLALAATLLTWVFGLAANPATATPSNVRIDKLYQLPCDNPDCSGNGDDPLGTDSNPVKGSIQIHARADSNVGLEWLRVEARFGSSGSNWVCLKYWETPPSGSNKYFNWNTTSWPSTPSGCSSNSAHGELTRNGTYNVRAVAREKITGDQANSSVFVLHVNNRPSAPDWAADPSVGGEDERDPIVRLRWKANPEPDVTEYHFVRTDPNGEEWAFAVSAKNPGGQGCDLDGGVYMCEDPVLLESGYGDSGYAGTREYVLYALRSSPMSGGCALSSGGCIRSQSSEVRSAEVEEPPPPPEESESPTPEGSGSGSGGGGSSSPSASPSARRSSSGSGGATAKATPRVLGERLDNSEFFQGEFERTLPYGQNRVLVPGRRGNSLYAAGDPLAAQTDDDRGPWTPLAAGLVLMLLAAHMARLLRTS